LSSALPWLFIPILWICRCRLLYLDFLFPCCEYVVVVCFPLTFYSHVVNMSLSSALPWLFIPMLWICRCRLLYLDFLFLCCEYVVVVCFTLTFYSHVVDMSLSSALSWLLYSYVVDMSLSSACRQNFRVMFELMGNRIGGVMVSDHDHEKDNIHVSLCVWTNSKI
jgi:hypothetical protein